MLKTQDSHLLALDFQHPRMLEGVVHEPASGGEKVHWPAANDKVFVLPARSAISEVVEHSSEGVERTASRRINRDEDVNIFRLSRLDIKRRANRPANTVSENYAGLESGLKLSENFRK